VSSWGVVGAYGGLGDGSEPRIGTCVPKPIIRLRLDRARFAVSRVVRCRERDAAGGNSVTVRRVVPMGQLLSRSVLQVHEKFIPRWNGDRRLDDPERRML